MQLAADDIAISINGYPPVILRPSLRAALRIARRYGGFAEALDAVASGNLTIMCDLVREGGGDELAVILDEVGTFGAQRLMAGLTDPLFRFLCALTGYDPEEPQPAVTTGEAIPFPDYFERLFRIATGAIGWAPEDAWTATPAEIIAAYEGRTDLLRQLFGSSDDDNKPALPVAPSANPLDPAFDPNARDPAFDRNGWNELRAAIARGDM